MMTMKRIVTMLLALAILLSMAACGAQPEVAEQPDASVQTSQLETALSADKNELSRQDQELIAELIGGEQNPSDLSDEELNDLIDQLLEQAQEEESAEIVDLGNSQKKEPVVDTSANEGAYDEDGAMNTPFDQVYPELIEKEQVEFSDESLLIKLRNDTLTDGLKAAGVGALELVVPMEGQAWYEAKLISGTDPQTALAAVRQLNEVLLAEYNYEIQTAAIDSYKHFDDETDEEFQKNGHNKDQWHFHHCGIPDGYEEMDTEGGSSSVIVAVIDTGVDYDHQDLADNMWFNAAEIPDNGIDDDGNGYVDDYYGIDMIAGHGSADDDNGHGTHVAGIIAAKNNNVGVVGIAYNVKIMPIKAAMHNGTLNQADIARSVCYAYEMGAEVINMSFGGTACSIAVQDALATAYTRCVLVASAGNSGKPNQMSDYMDPLPNYPAALTYVLGVMSVDENGVESSFSNWDTVAFNGVEYELYAPGENIMSTLPGDRYGFLSGTSMAAPVVSAMAAILRSEFTDRDMYPTKFIYGQLASTSDYYAECCAPRVHTINGLTHNLPQIVNLDAALTKLPSPEVSVQDYAVFDSKDLSDKNNGDGVIDAGETIALGMTLRNRWGMSENTLVTIDTLENGIADPYVQILNPTVNYGSVGTYSTQDCGQIITDGLLTGWEDPFIIKIADDVPNDYRMTFHVTVTCENALNQDDTAVYESYSDVELSARSGVILPSIIDEDMVLTKDSLYIIPDSTVITEGTTVRVEPGTHIQFWSNDPGDAYAESAIAYLLVNGQFLVEGTKEEPVYIYPSQLMDRFNVEMGQGSNGYISLKYADITNLAHANNNTKTENLIACAERCTFRLNYGTGLVYRYLSGSSVYTNSYTTSVAVGNIREMKDCVFYKLGSIGTYASINGHAERCIFVECGMTYSNGSNFSARDCVFLGNSFEDQTNPGVYSLSTLLVNADSVANMLRWWNNASDSEKDRYMVSYRPETGTTYIYAPGTDMQDIHLLLQTLGGGYAVVETEEEMQWIREQNFFDFNAGITYDQKTDTYLWSDGTPLADFFFPVKRIYTDDRLSIYNGKLTYYNSSYCLYEIPGQILPEEITLPEYTVDMDVETTYQLVPMNTPVQLPVDGFIYESTDETVLTVSETGLVTPVGPGTADVYVYSLDRAVSNYVSIQVKDYVALESLAFPVAAAEVAAGESMAVACILAPADTTRRNVTYTSSDDRVATVDKGIITGVSSGTAVITAACEGITATVEVTVYTKAASLAIDSPTVAAAMDRQTVALPSVTVSAGGEPVLEWSVMDPKVAKIEDGMIHLLAPGLTTLTVTDTRSGLSATATLYVSQDQIPQIAQTLSNGEVYYVRTQDGKVYYWTRSATPVLIAENAEDIRLYGVDLTILHTDHSVSLYRGAQKLGQTQAFSNIDVVSAYGIYQTYDVTGDDFGRIHLLTADGKVYARGGVTSGVKYGNDYGQLGLGTTEAVTELTQVSFPEPVVQMVLNGYITYYLTQGGNLYVTGGEKLKALTPLLVARNVTWLDPDGEYFLSDGCFSIFGESHTEATVTTLSLPEFDELDIVLTSSGLYDTYYNLIGIKNGKVYCGTICKSGSKTALTGDGLTEVFDGITNAAAVNIEYGTKFVTTADGLLYGAGDTDYLAGMTSETTVGAHTPVMIPMERTPESLYLTGDGLTGGVLTGDTLQLTFNKELVNAAVSMTENGMAVSVHQQITDNVLSVSCAVGFVENSTYMVTVSATGTSGRAGAILEEDVQLQFTYHAQNSTGDTAGDTAEEVVVHESVLDESVQRIRTPESFLEELTELQSKYQINSQFIGNAVLNRVTTDTDVTHWLRPVAAQLPSDENYQEIALGGNYWGTTNETAIQLQMVDYIDYKTYGRFMYAPYLTEAPENTFPFVTSVTVLNKYGETVTTVGNEDVTFRVTFNRDMDTSIPLTFRFGSAYPYGDYEVEGSYVDARTWEGKYTLNTLIENGYQYITIQNGCSATDDLDLQLDQARFGFIIDTSAAQALIMQGHPTDTGIQLTWTQDDFDTLMGYNVYRSTKEDGLYTRLNSTVIPAETMEWFDGTVEPGVVYYYNFTVVQTDLTESVPSGKISIMSKDTMAPDIYHTPVTSAFTGSNLVITATVTDNLSIAYANLYYRTTGTESWKTVRMNKLNDKYSAILPASDVTVEGIEYYIEAFDGVSYTYKGSQDTPFAVTVSPAVETSDLGDVDGDGVVTLRDAMVLLYAINDKYNMTAEEFARADLNGDGELMAAEALRILQYVNGTVGSLKLS